MSDAPDVSTWLTKAEAAAACTVATKTIERWAEAGKLQRATRRSQRGGADEVVYHPDDVARLATEKRPGPLPAFLVPGPDHSSNGNGYHETGLARTPSAEEVDLARLAANDALMREWFGLALRGLSQTLSQTPPTLFLTIPEASALSGLSQAFLHRMIDGGTLSAIRDRGWRIRRKDLEAL